MEGLLEKKYSIEKPNNARNYRAKGREGGEKDFVSLYGCQKMMGRRREQKRGREREKKKKREIDQGW